MPNDVEQVLANWITEATSDVGHLPPDTTPARWVAARFLNWWRQDFESRLDESFGDVESALQRIELELQRQGGWDQFGEVLDECAHLKGALGDLRQALLPSKG
jgi:hypothetical protein